MGGRQDTDPRTLSEPQACHCSGARVRELRSRDDPRGKDNVTGLTLRVRCRLLAHSGHQPSVLGCLFSAMNAPVGATRPKSAVGRTHYGAFYSFTASRV